MANPKRRLWQDVAGCQGFALRSPDLMDGPSAAPLALPVDAAQATLREYFGYEAFRDGQAEAIAAVLAGRDAVVLLPTGGGKSLCYQVPAIAAFAAGLGTTIVVSPLIALMNDQVAALGARGVHAAALHSHQEDDAQRQVVGRLCRGELAMLYVSPERAVLPGFATLLAKVQIALLAIDEAHCVSQWGHDFRPEYQRLHGLRQLTHAPVIAVTATATPRVLEEVTQGLALRDPVLTKRGFWRPNLAFSVLHAATDHERHAELIAQLDALGLRDQRPRVAGGRAIVYCSTRTKVETVAEVLGSHGFTVGYYHAGRTPLARERAERRFAQRKTKVLVATNAFGMGVDYPDVRLVFHAQAPASLEAYYQEAGRAGRDGLPGACVMMFGAGDLVTHRRMQRQSSGAQAARGARALAELEAFAHSVRCRQADLALHFTGEPTDARCGVCDVCTNRVGHQLADVNAMPPPVDAGGAPLKPKRATATKPTRLARASTPPRPRTARAKVTGIKLDLDTYRKRAARQLRWKPYMVLQQGTIVAIDQQRPTSLQALARIPGLGPAKIARFGAEILAIVRRNRE